MPVSSDIYSQVQAPQAANPLAALAQAYQIKAYQSSIGKADREETTHNALLRVVQDPSFAALPTPQKAAALQGVGAFDQAGKLVTTEATANKDRSSAAASELETKIKQLGVVSNVAGTVVDQASYDQGLGVLGQMGIDTSQWSKTYNPAGVKQFAEMTLTQKERLEAEARRNGQAETGRHNLAIEATGATNAKTAQGNLSVAQGNLGVARDRLAYDRNSPTGQVVQGENGTFLVDRRTGDARPVTNDGAPLQRPGKEIPAAVNKSIIENQQNISKIDRAIASIDKQPGALGTMNMIPGMETLRQYTDPEGVEARAGVADVGSLILHDRSGAAVTASETPRLRPFIPSASDTPEVAKKKLARFRELYEEEANLLSQTYGKSQGYRESPVLTGTVREGANTPGGSQSKAPASGSEPPAAAIAHLKANPALRAQFEAKYGRSAGSYLGQ
jgi:hypothetical protein